jgi:putative hydrolase of the HAD superfamily
VTAALLFDFGGTLDADGVPWKERFRRLYRAHGVAPPDPAFDAAFYAADDALLGAPPGCGLGQTVSRLAAGVSAGLGVRDARVTTEVAARFVADALAHVAGNRAVLDRLHARYRLGLVSNFYGNLADVCDEVGLGGLFDVVVDSTRVGCAKPDARIFRHAIDALGVTAAAATFVGDSPSRDMAGARGVGMRHVWLTEDPLHAPTPCCPGDPVICRLTAVQEVL